MSWIFLIFLTKYVFAQKIDCSLKVTDSGKNANERNILFDRNIEYKVAFTNKHTDGSTYFEAYKEIISNFSSNGNKILYEIIFYVEQKKSGLYYRARILGNDGQTETEANSNNFALTLSERIYDIQDKQNVDLKAKLSCGTLKE